MAYTAVPVDNTEALSVSQPKITENFVLIRTSFSEDHVDFNDPNKGKHNRVTFTEQAGDKTTAVNEMALYIKDAGTEPNLYLRKENDTTVFNLTPSAAGHAAGGYEVLPSGLKMVWGTETITSGNSSQDFNFTSAFTPPTAAYSVQITAIGTHAGTNTQYYVLSVTAITNVKFTLERGTTFKDKNIQFSYFAIGI